MAECSAAGETKEVDMVKINAANLMPEDMSYYAYDGSLTTPPCGEGVKWHVVKEPITLSAQQLKAFQAVFPVNARLFKDWASALLGGLGLSSLVLACPILRLLLFQVFKSQALSFRIQLVTTTKNLELLISFLYGALKDGF